jgi:hypothetical protein
MSLKHMSCGPNCGHVIDFWGLEYDLAERMGLLDEIESVVISHRADRSDRNPRATLFGNHPGPIADLPMAPVTDAPPGTA